MTTNTQKGLRLYTGIFVLSCMGDMQDRLIQETALGGLGFDQELEALASAMQVVYDKALAELEALDNEEEKTEESEADRAVLREEA